jgi:hypothetical protein
MSLAPGAARPDRKLSRGGIMIRGIALDLWGMLVIAPER